MVEFFAYNGLINAMVALVLGYYIVVYHRREEIGKISLVMIIAFGLWSSGYWMWLSSQGPTEALFSARILSLGSTLIPVAFLHWVITFLNLTGQHKKLIRFAYLLTAIFLLFGFSKLFVESVEQVGTFPFWPQAGIFYHVYIIVSYIGFIGYGLILLWQHYIHEVGFMRKRFLYILVGMTICSIGGLTNFFGWYGIPFPPYGNVITTLFVLVCAYAIIHYRDRISNMRLLGRM